MKNFFKQIVLALILLLSTVGSLTYADGTDPAEVRRRAAAFMGVDTSALTMVRLQHGEQEHVYSVFNDSANNAFVIMSNSGNLPEVLGYCDSSLFDGDDMPPQLRALLDEYDQIADFVPATSQVKRTSPKYASQFKASEKKLKTVPYNQGKPYNNMCPDGSWAGCVAAAMAIVTKYHEWPSVGRGEHSYEWNGKTLGMDFDFDFNWDKTLSINYGTNPYTTEQANVIAKIFYAYGVATNMKYSTDASATSLSKACNALIKYFKYSPNCAYINQENIGYGNEEWMALIKKEIDAGRPIVYEGNNGTNGGHAFVIQGYRDDYYVDVNWGWGGSHNGMYLLTSLIIPDNSDYDFSRHHGMIVNIEPDNNETVYSPLQRVEWEWNGKEGMSFDVDTIRKNEYFNFHTGTIRNRDDKPFSGELAVALTNSEDSIKQFIGNCVFELENGYITYRDIRCVSSELAIKGDRLGLYWRYSDEDEWRPMPNDGVAESSVDAHGVDIYYNGLYAEEDTVHFTSETSIYVRIEIENLREQVYDNEIKSVVCKKNDNGYEEISETKTQSVYIDAYGSCTYTEYFNNLQIDDAGAELYVRTYYLLTGIGENWIPLATTKINTDDLKRNRLTVSDEYELKVKADNTATLTVSVTNHSFLSYNRNIGLYTYTDNVIQEPRAFVKNTIDPYQTIDYTFELQNLERDKDYHGYLFYLPTAESQWVQLSQGYSIVVNDESILANIDAATDNPVAGGMAYTISGVPCGKIQNEADLKALGKGMYIIKWRNGTTEKVLLK